jgi:hypothetical protein
MGQLFPPDTAPKLYPDLTAEMARNAPAAMRTTTEQLLAAVKTGDRREVRRRLSEVERDGCGLCHRSP